ncbi:MAG: efflux RND transporter periplasmic adaptor subunit [Desulforhopalus sp.]
MKKFLLFVTVLLVVGGFLGYRYLAREKPVVVSVKMAEVGTVEATVTNTRAGSVKARRRARLAPSVGGTIAVLGVAKGDEVETGQLLVSLWNEDVKAQLDLARKQARAADATALQTCRMADYSGRQAERLTQLRQKQSVSESSYDEAIATAASQKAACMAAEAQRAVSLARIDEAEAMVERTIITAPFSGVVAEVNGEIGEFITPSPPGIATLPVIDLINMDSLYVIAPIDEIDAAQVRPGMETRITLDAFPKRIFMGKTRSISPYVLELAKQARTVEIEVDFLKPAREVNLLVGYSADVEIVTESVTQVVQIPTEALMRDGHVYVYDQESGRLENRQVVAGLANWQFTEIREGIAAGELVVTTIDREGLADGVKAEIDPEDKRV